MSQKKQQQEASRWFRTAQDDLKAAKVMAQNALYAHAGFCAQQAVEKALKALHFYWDLDPWGHSIVRLLKEISNHPLGHLIPQAIALDKLYIPTRYPDALPEIIPNEAFTYEEAHHAIEIASLFLEQIGTQLSKTPIQFP